MAHRSDALYLSVPGDRYTPFSLAKKLGARAILESASFSHGKERYSILLTEEAFRIVQDDKGIAFIVNGERKAFGTPNAAAASDSCNRSDALSGLNTCDGTPARQRPAGRQPDILDALEYVASQNAAVPGDVPLPAAGIGYLGYEFCARCDTVALAPQTDELAIPESEFIVGHVYIVFDHFTERLHICALNYAEHEIDLQKATDTLQKRLSDLDFSYLAEPETPAPCATVTDLAESRAAYIEKVNALKKHIVAGDLLQAVPSRRLRLECETGALEIYRRLRSVNPSPYLLYLDFGTHQLVGSSPESLVRVRSRTASIRPIAGTRRRGKNAAEDEKLKRELLDDPKERAEHLMLVDLARNDLGRVCEAGSVAVTRFMECEPFSHVMHLVSDVEGTVAGTGADGVSAVQVLRSAFPAGTVSGAPKIRAMEILSGLEKTKRNFYAGAVGYIDAKGGLDFCIAIRCALKQGARWTLQAGGGIVYDSVPEREWEETNEKLGAMLAVLRNA